MDLLEHWIQQLLQDGIEILAQDASRIEDISSRLVDHGIPSISKRLRILPEKITTQLDWKITVLQEIGEINLLIQILKKNSDLRIEELMRYLGTPLRKSDVESINHYIEDDWVFLGSTKSIEENIVVIKNWFIGINSNQIALYIEYIFNRWAPLRIFSIDKCYTGKIFFYPSSFPQRVTNIPDNSKHIPVGYFPKPKTIKDFLDHYCDSIIQVPWLRTSLLILQKFKIIEYQNKYYLSDDTQEMIELNCEVDDIPNLIALSLDPKAILVGEYEEQMLKPITVMHESGRMII